MRPGPLEERRKRLARLLSRSNKVMRQGIQLSEAITGRRGRHLSPRLRFRARRDRLKPDRLALRQWSDACVAEDEEPDFDL
jgi:hypothetical protein